MNSKLMYLGFVFLVLCLAADLVLEWRRGGQQSQSVQWQTRIVSWPLPGVQLGLRGDGAVVWRAKEVAK